ncbi:hypothetical protein ABNK63_16585 [Rhodanobacter sp. IGA1.0]|uniref:PepSY domain-containing protein n=1 Tax=Rhodanobacter sp. IGA1.0 TaxID=3158582 RepID=A0AAU7QK76_9GAMM
MRYFLTILLALALAVVGGEVFAQEASPPDITKSSGTTVATAIVLSETDDDAAIKAEDAWLGQHFPGYTKVSQALLNPHGHYYDAIEITTASQETKKIYFDITRSQNALIDMFKQSN